MTPAASTGRHAVSDDERVGRLAALIRSARSVVALTGAGISVPSGIPDFRTPGAGLWARVNPMEVAHINVFHRDPRRFWSFYGERFASLEDREPNAAHHALVALERRGLLDAVITQNVDMLHRKAGSSRLIELHGSIAESLCQRCEVRIDLAEARARLAADPEGVPRCACGTPLKPSVVLFGEMLPEGALESAYDLAWKADLMLCVGSSLEVYPVAELPWVTLRSGGQVALVTQGPTSLDDQAAVKLDRDVVQDLRGVLESLDDAG